MAISIRIGKPIALDSGWKLSLTTTAETVLAEVCEKIYQGNFDDDLKDKWKEMRTDRPSFEQLCDACSKLADAKAEVQAATLQDNQTGAFDLMSQCHGPFDSVTGACRGCDVCQIRLGISKIEAVKSEDPTSPDQQTPHSGASQTLTSMSDEKARLMAKAMHLRGQYHRTKVLRNASEMTGVLSEITAKCAFNKRHIGIFIDFDQFESEVVPWHHSAKYTDAGQSIQKSIFVGILKAIEPGVFCVTLAGMHHGTIAQVQKTIGAENQVFEASKKVRSSPMYLVKDETSANRSRHRGLANAADVETVLITTSATFRIFNVKRKSRLGVGTTFSTCIKNVETVRQTKQSSMSPAAKRELFAGITNVCLHTISYHGKDPRSIVPKEQRKQIKCIDRVLGHLPASWHPRHPDVYMELIHALDLRHVVDVFSVDASSSIASARYMHTKKVEKKDLHQCTVLCHNEAQERHLLWLLDNEYLDLMRDPESTIFQGDELKAEIDACFGPVTTTKKEGEDVSDGEPGQGHSSSDSED